MNNSKEQNMASGNPAEIVLDVYDSNNNLYTTLPGGTNGFKTGDTVYRYKDDAGKDVFTKDILDLPMYASLDEKTGDIIITAPGSIYNTDEFQKTFDKSILESYSLAYKLNPNYKVSVMEKNEETGAEEEKQVTIPEWIEKLNESFKVYKDNLRLVRDTKNNLVSQYGEKANNLSTAQINRILQNPTSGVYIPDILFSVNFFGDNPDLGNPFESIRGKSGADGSFTLDDLKSVFTRENFGRSELAGVLATIDGALKSSNWDKEDTYTDADGNTVKNRNSADEASKLIAFKDFLLKNHPESEWYQQVGDNIETLCLNFDYYTTRVFANIANVIEAGVTEGNGHAVQNWIKEDLDPTMEQYNMYSQMETDAAQAMQVIGMIGGTLLGSAGAGVIAKGLGALVLSPFAVGASLAVKAMPALQKLTTLTTIAKTFSTAHPMLSASASFLLDTLHDAILFDSTTLRDTLEAADGDTRAYWEGQLADNMKWWTGMAGARTLVKFAGKTPVGKTLDAWLTPYINKKLAVWGERKADFYDRMAGGSLIRKIEDQIRDAKYGSNKFDRLVKKHIQLEWNEILRTARKELGDIKIETKLGIFPTKEGYKALLDAKNNIKAIENAIDSYARNINYKVSEYISPQYDPATKQMRYINPDLAKANQNASDFYYKLVSLTKKYGLSVSDQGFLNQDMINYWVGSAHLETMVQMSKYGSADHAKLASENIPIIKKNIAAAKSALPQEITALIDQGIQNRIYQNWYKAQNEFAKHKGLVNAEQIDSYDNNPIWKEIGYMPANIKTEPTGRFIRKDGTVEAVISQDIEHFTYRVSKGQNYADPELVRFNKLRALAKADVNRDIIKAYNSLSSTKNVIKLSGEDTEYARKINENKKNLEKLLNVSASEQFKPGEFEFKLLKGPDGKQTVNVEIDLGTRSIVISNLSPDEVSQFLANKKVIKGKNGKISDNVNAENYNEWFSKQSSEVKKYLKQKYTEMLGEDVVETDKVAINFGEKIDEWTQSEWNAWNDIRGTINNMSLADNSLGLGNDKFYAELHDEINEMAKRVPYKGKRSISEIKSRVIRRLEENGIDAHLIERIDAPDRYTSNNMRHILNGDVDETTRIRLAKDVADNSDGKKLVAWRTQSDGTDNFYGSSLGSQMLDDVTRERWKGGRWLYINENGPNVDTMGRAGDNLLVFPVNKSDILYLNDVDDYSEAAEDLLSFRKTKRNDIDPREKAKYEVIRKSVIDIYGSEGNIPHYNELSKLDDYTLEKIANEDPRSLLKASGKKIIEYEVAGNRKEFVTFPDDTPEILSDGVKDMAKEYGGYDDVSDNFVNYNVGDIYNPADFTANELKGAPKIEKSKILDGSYDPSTRYKIAKTAAIEMIYGSNAGGNKQTWVLYRDQKNGIDNIKGNDAEPLAYTYKRSKEGDLDGAEIFNAGKPSSLSLKSAKSTVMFPVLQDDILNENTVEKYKKMAESLIAKNKVEVDADTLHIFGLDDVIPKELNSIIDSKGGNEFLKKVVDDDVRALLDISGKKILYGKITDGKGEDGWGLILFPDRNPEVFENGVNAMANIKNDFNNSSTLSGPALEKHLWNRLYSLINSKENIDFLNKLGWNDDIAIFKEGADRKGRITRGRHSYGNYEEISVNLKAIDNIEILKKVEFHEVAHAAWLRATPETREAIAKDLLKKMGVDPSVANGVECTRDMNELVAHAMDTKFAADNGWTKYINDTVTKEHLTNLAEHAGVKLDKTFKEKAMTAVKSFITFVKTKLLGINSARTFNEFYYGLLNGDFANDLKKRIGTTIIFNPNRELSKTGIDMSDYARRRAKPAEHPGFGGKIPITYTSYGGEEISVNKSHIKGGEDGPIGEVAGGVKGTGGDTPRQIPVTQFIHPTEEINVTRIYEPNSYELFKRAVDEGGAEFEAGLQRAYLLGDKNFSDSPLMNEAARNLENGKDAFYDGVVLTRIKGELRSLIEGFDVDTFSDDLVKSIRSHIEDYVNKITSNEGAKAVIDSLAGDANGADLFARYFSLKSLHEKANLDRAKKAMADAVWEDLKAHDITIKNGEKVRDLVGKVVNDVVEKELDDAASALRTVNPDLADTKDLFANVEKINNRIMGAEKKIKSGENGYVMYLDDNGREVYAQVDPAFASLYTYRYQIENAEASALAKMNAMMSRMFRYGTTSVNLSSFGNQLFRDFGNALLVGGSWNTIRKNADNLVDVFGERIVNEIKQFDPSGYEMRQVEQLAKDSGQTINEAAVSRELMRGSAIAPSTTETTLYAKFMKEAYGRKSDTDLNNLKSSVESLLEKYNPDKLLNGKRENYLRRRVYASSYNDAIKQGYNIEQARTYAEFAMNNATTNFSRQLYHLQAIADSTPYFRAAINGSKSFWRMWSLDPVGITGRITGGLIIPVMALTAFSLENKEDAEIYKNIPEYQKDSSIVFVFDGKPMSIPVPQEISNIINPFRHFVEYLNVAQPNAFHELAMNDLLGFAPYDLTGFSTVDMDHMASEPTFFDRVSRGFARIFSSMAPVPLKTVYMLATGTDPYTGKSLRDPKNNVYFNEETGTTEVMDYNQNAFARLLAEWFGDSGMSSNLAEKVVSGVVGTTGSNLLGDITALFREGGDAFMKSAATNIGEQIMKPFDVPVYNLADATWKREIKNLTFEKEALLNSKKMVALNNELKFATDPEKRKKILAERSNLVNEFTQKVGNLVKNLSEEYGGTFDRQKFAAVMNLLNFDSDAGYQSGTQASSDIALSGYWDGRDAAIHTMQQLGINGPNDASIFGYLIKDEATGKTVMKYTSPIAIMDMKQQWYNQDEINYANINALIKSNGIKDAHDSITKQINAIYGSKSRLSNADRANIEAIQINWNTQLAKVLAPYISQMTPEAAINNSKVLNLLYPYVEVPGSWEKNNSNRSPSLGDRGNKKKAYYDSWIKTMFSVNDRYKGQY